jgi:hypothetical protein
VDGADLAAGYFIKSFVINLVHICHGFVLHFLLYT